MSKSIYQSVFLPLLLLILLGTIWGSGYSIARYVMLHHVPPLGYTFLQTVGPAILLVLLMFLCRLPRQFSFKHWSYYLVTAVLGVIIPNTNMYIIAAHLPANVLAVVINISPIFIYVIALLLHQERFDGLRLIAVLLGLTGVFCVLIPKFSLFGVYQIAWASLALVTPFSFALCVVYISKFRPEKTHAITLSVGMLSVATILLLPVVFYFHQFYLFSSSFQIVNALILLKMVLISLGYILLFTLLKIAGPVYYSLIDGVVILTGLFWGWVVFHETVDRGLIVAVILIVSAISIMSFRHRQKAKS